MPEGTRRLSAIATGQHGAFTRAQAKESKVSSTTLRSRNQSGRLDRTGYRTYRDPMSPQDVRTELSDFLLDVGDGWISHTTAAALHGLDGFSLRKPFHATV